MIPREFPDSISMTMNINERKDSLKDSIERLYDVMTILRSPEGCPWDRIQTEKSATESLLDECYEYMDAVIEGDDRHMREEIGDVLINLMMNLIIAEQRGAYSASDAVNDAADKLIRRHQHVFGDIHVSSPDDVIKVWNDVKEKVEGRHDDGFFSNIPKSLPPLEESYEIQKKMRKAGFDWPDQSGVFEKVEEELKEVKSAFAEGNPDDIEEEIGDLLFTVINLSRALKIRPVGALMRTNQKIRNRFLRMEELLKEEGLASSEVNIDEMERLWQKAKVEEKTRTEEVDNESDQGD